MNGDDLYREIMIVDDKDVDIHEYNDLSPQSVLAAKQYLLAKKNKNQNRQQLDADHESSPSTPGMESIDQSSSSSVDDNEPPYLWGGLSVGPVLKSALLKQNYLKPNPIQQAAFESIISSKKQENAIIASPTGSGKSLAYLIPLLASLGSKEVSKIWIITPTLELATQLQKVVHSLSPPSSSSKSMADIAMVLQPSSSNKDDDASSSSLMMSSINLLNPTILIGTPRRFLELLKNEKQSWALLENLQTIVLDEADRLLKTEDVAIANYEWKLQKEEVKNQQGSIDDDADDDDVSNRHKVKKRTKKGSSRTKRPVVTFTEDVVSQCLDRRLDRQTNLQIICASATVGRTLRKQIMDMTRASSMDKASKLITADIRTKKDAHKRKLSLLPQTLQHYYHAVGSSDDDKDTGEDPKSAILRDLSNVVFCDDKDGNAKNIAVSPGPTLVFPGRIGVDRVQEILKLNGFQNVYGLEDVSSSSSSEQHESSALSSAAATWKDVPIYVVNEKVSRGLDLDYITNVVLLQVPKTVASYTHLAGRTGRNGSNGNAVTLLCPPMMEAMKLQVIADTLGLTFQDITTINNDVVEGGGIILEEQQQPNQEFSSSNSPQNSENEDEPQGLIDEDASSLSMSWKSLSDSSLKRKTIAEITEYLLHHKISVSSSFEDGTEKKLKKADLLQAVDELHNRKN